MYFKYLKTVIKHKVYVFLCCCKCNIVWRGLIHDNSKLSPQEFPAYARYFSGKKRTKKVTEDFDRAWKHHKENNPHHPEYWERIYGACEDMPIKYIKEMICDWVGAEKAYNKDGWTINTLKQWWKKNKSNTKLGAYDWHAVNYVINNSLSEEDLFNSINIDIERYINYAHKNPLNMLQIDDKFDEQYNRKYNNQYSYGLKQDAENIYNDWVQVGEYLKQVMGK